jgi:2-succinyl-5-enolpyruvyl-6-hydroxy-3-cyclohexene-1-carboxylate synthase
MKYPKIPLAQSIIEICRFHGVRHVVIAPGSRNAPLTIGFASHPDFQCYSIADERCAAFFALGIAQQLNQPVAVVCTSGSAVLNFYPAVAEAFYSMIPLVVISADRPSDKIDIGDGQTIRQDGVMALHTVKSVSLTEEASEANDILINEALHAAVLQKGPVHINAPFEEPLYATEDTLTVDPLLMPISKQDYRLDWEEIIAATNLWNNAERKLVLVGSLDPEAVSTEVIHQLATDPSVLVMTETTSNLQHPFFIHDIDTFITPFSEEEVHAFAPQVLITFGGMVVSKRIKSLLRTHPPKRHIHIDPLRAYDTFGALTHHFKVEVSTFFEQIAPHVLEFKSHYRSWGQQLKAQRKSAAGVYLQNIPFSDLKVFEYLAKAIPLHYQIQMANSSSVRYAQLFEQAVGVPFYCNRGTSGIDGSTSTAIGAALISAQPVVCITGDISFFYDSNALWNAYIPKNFKIIVINNGGGGIFRILPGHQEQEVFHTYFETAHCLTAQHLAAMYGFEYHTASDAYGLQDILATFFTVDERPQLLEIFTPTRENDGVLKGFFKAL